VRERPLTGDVGWHERTSGPLRRQLRDEDGCGGDGDGDGGNRDPRHVPNYSDPDARAGRHILVQENDVYGRVGEQGVARGVAAFYRRVPQDEVLGPMYPPEDLPGAQERLRDFLIYRFGGPQRYLEQRGHPRLRARHGRFAIDARARDRWMQLMAGAIAVAGVPADVEI